MGHKNPEVLGCGGVGTGELELPWALPQMFIVLWALAYSLLCETVFIQLYLRFIYFI